MAERRDLRACFLGDSYVAGAGDDSGLGWVGRVTAAARAAGVDLTPYNLGVRRETGPEVAARAVVELPPRLRHADAYALVCAFGTNDVAQDLPLELTLEALERMIALAAEHRVPIFVLSPPVMTGDYDLRAAEMTLRMAEICAGQGTPFLDLREAVADWTAWWAEARAGDGAHPNGAYQLVADAVGGWTPWQAWLGL